MNNIYVKMKPVSEYNCRVIPIKTAKIEIEHEYTSNIVCPYCGREDGDSCEEQPGNEDLGNIECGECGKTFAAERIMSVDYCTYKIDWLEEWKKYNKKKLFDRKNREDWNNWNSEHKKS